MPNTFFAMLARMKLIRRWGLMFSVREENLAEHTLDTAFFTHALIALHNARFLPAGEAPLDPGPGVQLALYHDAPEILTGDLPTPVKYFSGEIHTAYRAVEHAAAERARALWEQGGGPVTEHYDLSPGAAELGMVCGGSVDVEFRLRPAPRRSHLNRLPSRRLPPPCQPIPARKVSSHNTDVPAGRSPLP